MIHSMGQLDGGLELENYNLIVCNPGFSTDNLARIREKCLPNVVLAASVNAHSIPLWGVGNYGLDALRRSMRSHVAVQQNGWDLMTVNPDKTVVVAFSSEAAHKMSNWMIVELDHFDRIYLDDTWGDLPPWFMRKIQEQTGPYFNDHVLQIEWEAYRDLLLNLCAAKQSCPPVICNTAGWVPDEKADASFCIEKNHMSQIEAFRLFANNATHDNIGWGYTLELDGVVMRGTVLA